MRDAHSWGQSHPLQGTHSGNSIFPRPCQHAGRDGQGLLSSLPEPLPPPAPAGGVSRAPQGRAGQAGCNGGLVPTAISPFPICAAKVTPASQAIVLTVCKKEIKTSLFGRHEQQRNNKKEKKNLPKPKQQQKIQQEENIQAAPRHKVSPALSTVPMALWLHPSQSRGSPHRQSGGEANLLLAAQKLLLVEGSPKRWEFQP